MNKRLTLRILFLLLLIILSVYIFIHFDLYLFLTCLAAAGIIIFIVVYYYHDKILEMLKKKKLSFYICLLSTTRTIFPFCRKILLDSTNLTSTLMPVTDPMRFLIVSRKDLCFCSSRENILSVTSIINSRLSIAPFLSTTS